ncbi:MAG: sigma-E factor negative regulatory protein [Woeseiaceae bacterium]
MNDKTDRLSALMDGEVRDQDKWLEELGKDDEMQQVWRRYHVARDAMKGQLSNFPALDISAAVSESLKNEPVILTPIWQRLNPRYIMKQAAGLAVAAAVGTIAVISVQQTQITVDDNIIAQAATAPIVQLQAGQLRQVSFTTRQKLDAAVESKLSGYLVNHNEYSKTVRVSGVMAYTRIVSFVPSNPTK